MTNRANTTNPFETLGNQVSELREAIQQLTERLPAEGSTSKEDIGGVSLAMELLGLSSHSIYRLVFERKIPHMKRGGKLYFSRQALNKHLAQCERRDRKEGNQ